MTYSYRLLVVVGWSELATLVVVDVAGEGSREMSTGGQVAGSPVFRPGGNEPEMPRDLSDVPSPRRNVFTSSFCNS